MVLLLPLLSGTTHAQQQLDRVFLNEQEATLRRYLGERPLLRVVGIRYDWHPDAHGSELRAYRLDLSYVFQPPPSEQKTAASIIDSALIYQQVGRFHLSTLFYKLIHLLGVPRAAASIHFRVAERELAVFLDTQKRELVMQPDNNRTARKAIDLSVLQPPLRRMDLIVMKRRTGFLLSPLLSTTLLAELPRTIHGLIEKRFREVTTASGLPAPVIDAQPLEPDYVGISVSGIKKQVLTDHNYWEKLRLAIEIKTDPSGLRLVCYIDGQFAAGLGSAQPMASAYADMEPEFESHLARFQESLLYDMSAQLAKRP